MRAIVEMFINALSALDAVHGAIAAIETITNTVGKLARQMRMRTVPMKIIGVRPIMLAAK